MNDDIYDPLTSYFEIAGEIVEVVTDPPQSFPEELEILQGLLEEGYDLSQAQTGFQKVRVGSTSLTTGGQVLRAALVLAAADGPLPIGDFIAAGLLLGAGGYLIYDGYKDMRQ